MFHLSKLHHNRLLLSLALLALSLWTSGPMTLAQTGESPLPPLSGYVNDFAEVVDPAMKQRMEKILSNLKEQAGIEFVLVTAKTTGSEDIFDYSMKVARAWGINSREKKNALLLLVSVDNQKSFTHVSRRFEGGLPDGLIGEMNIRMRQPFASGNFSEGLMTAVQTIAATLSAQRGVAIEDVDEKFAYGQLNPVNRPSRTTTAAASSSSKATATKEETASTKSESGQTGTPEKATTPASDETVAAKNETPKSGPTSQGRRRTGAASVAAGRRSAASRRQSAATNDSTAADNKETPKTEEVAEKKEETSSSKTDETLPKDNVTETQPQTAPAEIAKTPASSSPASVSNSKAPASNGEDESEQVELTLTLPPAERVEKLKAFMAANPQSKSMGRAAELLVSARAALGDEKLRAGDAAGGVEQFRLAIAEGPANVSDKLFAGVIAQIPLNLFLRNERAAALEFARLIEDKFKDEPKRLLAMAAFYLEIEDASEAARLAQAILKLAPDNPAAHQALGAARRMELRLDDAAAEYARALELDPKSTRARQNLADLQRASGKAEEALKLYREQLKADASDKQARTGMVLSLFDAGKRTEAESELQSALKDDPRNLPLLVGAAYWYVAHNEAERGLELAQKAVEIEPRYTWAHIALARALVALKRPLEAERALRFVRQYGRFPTLDYELAHVLAAAGLYEEATEELARSFTFKDGEIATQLAGRFPAHSTSFTELLAPERRASIFQPVAADTEAQAQQLKGLFALNHTLNPPGGRDAINEKEVLAAAKEFTAGDDVMRVYRQLYVASRLVQRGVALPTALSLTEAAMNGIEAALTVPFATVAVQADELREIRLRAIASGGTPDIPEAPRNALANILRGRIEDLTGWALFNQDKTSEALSHLRRAASVLPEGTPALRDTLWHLGVALEASGNGQEALGFYIKSYNSGLPDPARRTIIEALYRKINGSLEGLDEKIGPSAKLSSNTTTAP